MLLLNSRLTILHYSGCILVAVLFCFLDIGLPGHHLYRDIIILLTFLHYSHTSAHLVYGSTG